MFPHIFPLCLLCFDFQDFQQNGHQVMLNGVPEDFKNSEKSLNVLIKGDCHIQGVGESSLFFLSCFLQPSQTFGSPMSIRANHRIIDSKVYAAVNDNGKCMGDEIQEEASSQFQALPVYVFPYTIYESNAIDNESHPVKSLSRAPYNWIDANDEKCSFNAELHANNLRGRFVSMEELLVFCYFFGLSPYTFVLKSSSGSIMFDWNVIYLGRLCLNGTSLDQICRFCAKLDIPFECDGTDVVSNNRRFRAFIQYCLPVRLAMVEGNHRMEAGCRRFYGMKLLDAYSDEQSTDGPPLAGCTMCQLMAVRTVQLPLDNSFTDTVLGKLVGLSRLIQSEASTVIASSWITFVHSFLSVLSPVSCDTIGRLLRSSPVDVVDSVVLK